ncbi:MAG: hypothetical protein IPL65_11855 [Lewinellaceae bacterium]|nr:hypothetical protein [Lewinellaceae bacterium]
MGLPQPEQRIDKPLGNVTTPAKAFPLDIPRTDTIPDIPPGALFQIPDYLSAPSPDAAAQPEVARAPEEKPVPVEGLRPIKPLRRGLAANYPSSVIRFYPSRIVPYRLHFRTDYISTSMDNNLLFEGLDSYAGTPGTFRTPPPGILIKANFKDLLEDYVVEAGFRLPTTFNGAEYYLWMDNKRHRLDKRYALYRRTNVTALNNIQQVRNNTILGQYELRYPLILIPASGVLLPCARTKPLP